MVHFFFHTIYTMLAVELTLLIDRHREDFQMILSDTTFKLLSITTLISLSVVQVSCVSCVSCDQLLLSFLFSDYFFSSRATWPLVFLLPRCFYYNAKLFIALSDILDQSIFNNHNNTRIFIESTCFVFMFHY